MALMAWLSPLSVLATVPPRPDRYKRSPTATQDSAAVSVTCVVAPTVTAVTVLDESATNVTMPVSRSTAALPAPAPSVTAEPPRVMAGGASGGGGGRPLGGGRPRGGGALG